jgi:diguanylate cyclase (GGDEF)-like protein
MSGPDNIVLHLPTLAVVGIGLADLLGLFLVFCWLQDRAARALAWWGSAYFIGAFSLTLWLSPGFARGVAAEIPEALTLLACGVIWSGIRLFHGRPLSPTAAFAGAILWPVLCQIPEIPAGSRARLIVGAVVAALYTFAIAREFWRERRQSLKSRTAGVIVPALHASIFLVPAAMELVAPEQNAAIWLSLFVVQVMIYSLGGAFIVLLMVKDRHLTIYRTAAETDHLTGLLNRRAFIANAVALATRNNLRDTPVTLMMFDLDHFKSINDRFGHATGDAALCVFAETLRATTRAHDIVGRLGGEEFAAIVPGDLAVAGIMGERIRAAFERAAVWIDGHSVGGTVSIGAATALVPVTNLDALLASADAALYDAKRSGRNRLCVAPPRLVQDNVPLVPELSDLAHVHLV